MIYPSIHQSLQLYRQKGTYTACLHIEHLSLEQLQLLQVQCLHPNELTYFNTLPAARRQHSYLLGRYAGKSAIAGYLQEHDLRRIEIKPGVFEQPIVIHPRSNNIQLSISHSGNWGMALAFPEPHPMGIDVEDLSSDAALNTIVPLSPQEQKAIATLPYPANERMILVWTIKEALSKVFRTGLTADLSIYELDQVQQDSQGLITTTYKHFMQYRALSWIAQGHAWSLVLPRKTTCDVTSVLRQLTAQ